MFGNYYNVPRYIYLKFIEETNVELQPSIDEPLGKRRLKVRYKIFTSVNIFSGAFNVKTRVFKWLLFGQLLFTYFA